MPTTPRQPNLVQRPNRPQPPALRHPGMPAPPVQEPAPLPKPKPKPVADQPVPPRRRAREAYQRARQSLAKPAGVPTSDRQVQATYGQILQGLAAGKPSAPAEPVKVKPLTPRPQDRPTPQGPVRPPVGGGPPQPQKPEEIKIPEKPVAPQTTGDYGTLQGLSEFVGYRYGQAQKAVQEAGQSNYQTPQGSVLTPSGALDTFLTGAKNITQVPYIGKPLEAVKQSFLFTLGTPAEVTERALGALTKGNFEFDPLAIPKQTIKAFTEGPQTLMELPKNQRTELEVQTPEQERAFQAAMGVAFSGPEAVRRTYKEALQHAQAGNLSQDVAEQVQAKHGVWWKEMAGQVLLDPFNLLNAPGKAVQAVTSVKRASNLVTLPFKEGAELASTAKVLDRFSNLATVKGQKAAAESNFGKLAAMINPRFKNSIVVQEVERMQQPLNIMFGGENKQALAKAKQFRDAAIARGEDFTDTDFAVRYQTELGTSIQNIARNMVLMASDKAEDIKKGHQALKQMGYGDVSASITGRGAGLVMKEIMTNPKTGEVGNLVDIMKAAKDNGLSAEHVAEAWAVKAADVLDGIIKTPGFEKAAPVKAIKSHLEWRQPIDGALAKMYMGTSFGYAMRNLFSDTSRLLVEGLSPFGHNHGLDIATKQGVELVGVDRAIGAVGEKVEGSIFTTFGTRLGGLFEQYSGRKVMSQLYTDALQRTWGGFVKNVDFSRVPEQYRPYLQRAVTNLGFEGADEIARLKAQVLEQARGAAGGVVPPAAQAASPLEMWRQPSRNLAGALQTIDEGATWNRVRQVLKDSQTPEEAILKIEELKKTALEKMTRVSDAAEPIGHAQGTLTGQAFEQMLRSDDLPPKTIEALAESLGELEHGISLMRSKAMASASQSVRPEEWITYLDKVDAEYSAAREAIRLDQTVAYMELEAGLIDEAEYVDLVYDTYNKARNTLSHSYTQIISEAGGIETLGSLEEMRTPLLRREVAREAFLAGYPSTLQKGADDVQDVANLHYSAYKDTNQLVNDAHFNNKLRQIIGKKKVNQLTDDEALEVINTFRAIQEKPPLTYDQVYNKYATYMQEAQVPRPIGERLLSVPPSAKERGRKFTAQDLAINQSIYDMDDQGNLIFRPVQQALAEGNPEFRNIVFKRDEQGNMLANRSSAHTEGDHLIDGQLNDAGQLELTLSGSDLDELTTYAADLIRSGIPADSPVIGPTAFGKGLKFPMTLEELAGDEAKVLVWAIDPSTGQKMYANVPGMKGEVPYEDMLAHYQDLMRQASSKNEEAQLAARAVQDALTGNAPPLSVGPSSVDASQAITQDTIRYLDGLQEEVRALANVPPPPPNAMAPRPDDLAWIDEFFNNVQTGHTNSLAVSADVARRGRDRILLDYRDRRLADPFIKTLYPFGYWQTRSIPNWAVSLTMNPQMLAHYFAYKRELRDWNSQDPDVPEWARDSIVLRPPGFDGTVFWNLEAAFNPIQALFDNYDDPEQTKNILGKSIDALSVTGAAPHPLLLATYAAERGIVQGDQEGARSYGYLMPATRAFAATTGITLEPWLWASEPVTGKRTPWQGGQKGELVRTGKLMAGQVASGDLGFEEGILGVATRKGPAFSEALKEVLSTRQIPALGSWLLGVRLTPQTEWEAKLYGANSEYAALKDAMDAAKTPEQKALAQEQLDTLMSEKPWLGIAWMSNDNDRERVAALARSVLSRIPPGVQGNPILEKAGIIPEMKEAFYDPNTPLGEWDEGDYEQFARGVVNLAGVFGTPDKKTGLEWRKARNSYQDLRDDLNKKYPGFQEQSRTYQALLGSQGEEAAKEYGQTSGFFDALGWQKAQMLKDPILLKYYADPADVDSAANSLAYDMAEQKFPGIHALEEQYYSLPKEQQRQFRIDNPQLKEYWKEKDRLKADLIGQLEEERAQAGTGEDVPYVIQQGKPTIAQRGVLNMIEEMGLEASLPEPTPKEEPAKWSQEQLTAFEQKDQIYAQVQQQFPDAAKHEATYNEIKRLHGEPSAKIYAQKYGLYDYWNQVKLAQITNPAILSQMGDDQIQSAAKAVVMDTANRQWPGISQIQAQYYALPKGKARTQFLKSNPQLKAYWNWKDQAEPRAMQIIYQQRATLLGAPPLQQLQGGN